MEKEQKKILKKWVKLNNNFIESNPDVYKTLLDNPLILSRLSQHMTKNNQKYRSELNKIESKNMKTGKGTSGSATQKPKFGLPSIIKKFLGKGM
jgi:hypothetical protein